MFNISFGEILVFTIIALIILGPEKFLQALRSAIQKYQKLKTAVNKIQQDFEQELEVIELKQLMQDELARIKQNEQELKDTLAKMQQELDEVQSMTQPSSLMPVKSVPQHIYYYYDNPSPIPPYQAEFYLVLNKEVEKVA